MVNSRGSSSSPVGLTATEGTEVARLDSGAEISEGGEAGVTGESNSTGDRRVGVVIADGYLTDRTKREATID